MAELGFKPYAGLVLYISFFIMAVVVRKSENRTRRITGNVMIVASIPGMIISIGNLGLFIYTMVRVYLVAASNEYSIIGDSPVVKDLMDICNTIPITCLELSIIFFFALALIAIICGTVLLVKKAGKVVGIVTLVYGLVLMAPSCLILVAVMAFWAS